MRKVLSELPILLAAVALLYIGAHHFFPEPKDPNYQAFIASARQVRAGGLDTIKKYNAKHGGMEVTWSGVILEYSADELGTTITIGVNDQTPMLDQATFFLKSDLRPRIHKGDPVTLRGQFFMITNGMGILIMEGEVL